MVNTSLVSSGFSYQDDIFTLTHTGNTDRLYLFTKNVTALDNTKDVRFDQIITVNAMPVSAGTVNHRLSMEGYYFILCDEKNTDGTVTYVIASLFNHADKGLVLYILGDGVTKNYAYDTIFEVVLGLSLIHI